MLTLFDTLSRERVPLRPAAQGPLTLYSCGPTVYRYAHIGNLRTFLVVDLARRVLDLHGVAVQAVQNITDVGHMTDDQVDHGQDKMLLSAGLEGRSPPEIADYYTRSYLADAAALNLLAFDAYPRATEHIDAMLELIGRLERAGHAYDTPDAVYFDVTSFPDYGRLSGNLLGQLQAGHGAPSRHKRFHGDFALWRKAGQRRTMVWDSPWGAGFPGWHIECSAMSMRELGERIDVHFGGADLRFPHHECEIAQSDAAAGHSVVQHWVHSAHLLAEGRKMSKSAGNFFDLRTIRAEGVDPLAFRLLCLQTRHSRPLNFSREALRGADRTLRRLRGRVAELSRAPASDGDDGGADLDRRFVSAVDDDLDLPTALQVAHATAAGEGEAAATSPRQRAALLTRWDAVLGLDLASGVTTTRLPHGAAELLERRERARTARDFAAADALRAELRRLGVDVTDTPEGPRWTVLAVAPPAD